MKNLPERLDKHLQGIREGNGIISPKELFDLMKSRKNDLQKLNSLAKNFYITDNDIIFNAIDNHQPSYSMFSDSYVGDKEYNFMAYCICNYLGVDSGISINQAYRDIDNLVKEAIKNYNYNLREYPIQQYIDQDPRDSFWKEVQEYCKKYNIPVKEMTWDADDSGDEYLNPVDFAADAAEFARLCGAHQLANKLKPLSDKAEWISARIYLA